ncbi:MAG: hypothetical protein ABSA64_07480 [Sedimentisphaerales bacterium]
MATIDLCDASPPYRYGQTVATNTARPIGSNIFGWVSHNSCTFLRGA